MQLSRSLRYAALVILTAGLFWGLWELGPYRGLVVIMMFLFVVGHELCGHLQEMRTLEVPVEEVGFGIPVGPFRQLQVELPLPSVPFRVMVSPLLVAAYVDEGEAGRQRMNELSHADKSVIFGAGVSFNLIITCILGATLILHEEQITASSALWAVLWLLVIWLVVVRPISDFPRVVMAYIFPVLGVALLIYLGWLLVPALVHDFGFAIANGGALAGQSPVIIGPKTVVSLISGTQTALHAHVVLFLLSAGLTTANLLPIKGLDGGQIAESLVGKWVGNKAAQLVLWTLTGTVGLALLSILIASEFGIAALYGSFIILAGWLYDKRQKKRLKART